MSVTRLLAAAPLALLALPTAAGADRPAAHAATAGVVRVTEKEYSLTPSTGHVTIHNGKVTVHIHNGGAVTHALSLEKAGAGGKDIRTRRIGPGRSLTVTFAARAGRVEWYCPLDHHKALGMKGVLVVKR